MTLETDFLSLITNSTICVFLTTYVVQFSNLQRGDNYSIYLIRLLSTNTKDLKMCKA